MNRESYRAAVDSVKFRESFEQDTIELLRAAETKKSKEKCTMNRKKLRLPILIPALIALLAASALALNAFLSPHEVAKRAGDDALASAFASEDAVFVHEAAQSGDYTVTLEGIVSGKGLTSYDGEAQADKSYVVASVAYADGHPIADSGELSDLLFTPLVSGYKPWQVNGWTLGGGFSSFIDGGVAYYLFECDSLEVFADHTVLLAAFEGNGPSAEIFAIDGDGNISYADGYSGLRAMFTLPLDPAKADADAAGRLLTENGVIIE